MPDSPRITSIFCFNAAPVTAQPLLEEHLRHSLEPLLSVLDEFSLPAAGIVFSGATLDTLLDLRIYNAALRKLVEAKKLEIILSRYYEPISSKTSALSRASHWQVAAQCYDQLELPLSSTAYLPQGSIDYEIAAHLAEQNISSCLLPLAASQSSLINRCSLKSFKAPFTDNPVQLIPCSLRRASLLEKCSPIEYIDELCIRSGSKVTAEPASAEETILHTLVFSPEDTPSQTIALNDSGKWLRVFFRHLEVSHKLQSLSSALEHTKALPPDLALLKSAPRVCFTSNNQESVKLTDAASLPSIDQATPEQFLMHRMVLDLSMEYRKALMSRQNIEGLMPLHGRLASAGRFLCKCRDRSFYRVSKTSHTVSPQRIEAFFESLLFATVDVDTAAHPDIDPNNGWVFLKALDIDRLEGEILVVDSQLMRLHFLPALQGSAATLLYKPRKVNLFPTLSHSRNGLFGPLVLKQISTKRSLIENLQTFATEVTTNTQNSSIMIPKQTPGLLTLRFSGPLSNCETEYREFTFRAGIGAHLQNATTGFALEFWVESESASDQTQLIELSWAYLIPSSTPNAATGLALHSVGGISKTPLPLDQPHFLSGEGMEGGLYGLRLVDGLNGITTDWRCAKPLHGLSVVPQFAPDPNDATNTIYIGSAVRFYTELKRACDPNSPNTMFLSIM